MRGAFELAPIEFRKLEATLNIDSSIHWTFMFTCTIYLTNTPPIIPRSSGNQLRQGIQINQSLWALNIWPNIALKYVLLGAACNIPHFI